ncbi:MAG TPA: hypothetical protein VIV58_19245, partial [Kofleriaceae bacterium]
MSAVSAVIRHVAESIGAASGANAEAARAAVAGAAAPMLERLAAALAVRLETAGRIVEAHLDGEHEIGA